MKRLISSLFSIQFAILIIGLVFIFYRPMPIELLQLDVFLLGLSPQEHLLTHQASSKILVWYSLLEIIPWICILSFTLFVLPRVRLLTASLLCVLVIVMLVGFQLFSLYQYQLYFPQGLSIQFVIITSPLIIIWAGRSRAWQFISNERDEALMELSHYKLQQGQLEQVKQHLSRCTPSLALAKIGYELAVQHEQKRSYKEAQHTYRWLASFAPKYRDVAVKARAPLDQVAVPTMHAMDATQTMALGTPQQAQPVLGRYQIQKELGRGAMGVVYLGVDPKISRQVAIKTLNYKAFDERELPELKDRFFREAQAAGRLTHPNIVTIFDVGEEPDLSFIAMDYIAGETLREHVAKPHLLDIALVFKLIAQVADALEYAHQLNIVHRDIKPGNLLYNNENKQVKVADFGIARIVDNSKTKTGSILGSPMYMSPEQLKGHKATPASDIYSLGATFYQLLTGQAPYQGENMADLTYKVVNQKFKSVRELRPDLPSSATRIINKAMAKEATKRFEHAGLMANALRKSLAKDFNIKT